MSCASAQMRPVGTATGHINNESLVTNNGLYEIRWLLFTVGFFVASTLVGVLQLDC